MNPDLRNLIVLQEIDTRIVTLKKQISEIPEKAAACREEARRLELVHQGRVTQSQELARQRRAREGDVEMMRTKLSRLKEQLMAVKTNKEYTAMLHEIQTAETQIRTAEDGILEIMEQMESLEGSLAREATAYKSRQAELQADIRGSEEAVPNLQAEVEKLLAEKTTLEARIAVDLLKRYHRIAEARKGVALAEAKDELCSACHVRIRPQVFSDLMRTEEIHVCDSCSRILFHREAG